MIIHQILPATISIIFLVLYYYFIGSLLYPFIFSSKKNYDKQINQSLFLGLISNTTFLYLWNLFFPINEIGFVVFILICFFIGVKYRIIKNIRNNIVSYFIKYIPFIFLISTWLGFLSNNMIGPYDLGLYHLQVIKWAESFHVVKGIGNLHSRLGFSCSSWLLSSQFNVVFNTKLFLWTHGAIYLIIGFINFLYLPVFSKIRIKKSEKIIRIFYLPMLVNLCFSSFPGTSSDLPVFLFTSIISIYYFRFIAYKENDSINMIFILAVLGLSSKLTFAAVIIGLSFPLIFIMIKQISNINYLAKGIVLLSLTTFILWSYRNVIMTGYPFYPYNKISFPVEWKMNQVTVENIKNQITIYSTGYTDIKKLKYKERLKWYLKKITVQHRKIEIYYPIIIGVFGLLYSLIFIRKKFHEIVMLALPSIFPILLWTQIPGSRFFSSSFWWFGIAFIVYPLTKMMKNRNYNYLFLLIVAFSISIHVLDRLGSPKNFFPMNIKSEIPDITTKKNITNQGLTYFLPKDDLCWDSPLPCSPEPEFWLENVVQITEGKIWEGYRIKKLNQLDDNIN